MSKQTKLFDWNDIPLLLALAAEGRMRAASLRLGVDVSTLSRRLAAAERNLKVRLFVREAEGYQPTEAGRAFLSKAVEVEAQVRTMLSAAQEVSDTVAGIVRITSVDLLLDDWLVPRLPSLIDSHPSLEIKLIPRSDNLSFARGEADLALRIARPKGDSALLMRKVGKLGMAVFGSARRKPLPRERWGAQPWLALDEGFDHVPDSRWMQQHWPNAQIRLRSESAASLTRACEAGLGLALLPCFSARKRKLVQWSQAPEMEREVWLLSHRDTGRQRRFRLVADWLAASLKADRELMLGQA